jgi:BirA family biotin operon repressor/biotin-[acetyl-CoA-carboxylase] ligase
MVDKENAQISVRAKILKIFREEPGVFLTGESLAKELGVSRTAVWKQVKVLESSGYPLEIGAKGYRWNTASLSTKDDFIYPWEFAGQEQFFHHWDSTDSTMNRAAELAGKNYPGGQILTAGEQSAGRGRNGRNWASKKGGLFFTLLERPALAVQEYSRMTMAAQLAVLRALKKTCGKDFSLFWPNDIYTGGRKIAGVLTEFQASGDRIIWLSVGIGVNVNNRTNFLETANCAELVGWEVSRREVLTAILDEWEKTRSVQTGVLRDEWNAAAGGVGRRFAAVDGKGKQVHTAAKGVFLGIDAWGRGILGIDETSSNVKEKRAFIPGAVSFLEI